MKDNSPIIDMPHKVSLIYQMVEDVTGATPAMIQGTHRRQTTVDARKILANLLRKRLKLTCHQTGYYMRKDHSAIVYYEKKHEDHIIEPEYKNTYSIISSMIAEDAYIEGDDTLRQRIADLQEETKSILKALRLQSKMLDIIAEGKR